MATSISTDENQNQHLEMFCLIWLDSNPQEGLNTEKNLRSIINQLKKFQDIDQCQQFIQKTSSKDRLIFIVSERLGREILPKIHHLRQVISIYIYCMDKQANEQWSSKYSKVKNVVTSLNELISIVTNDYRIEKKIEEPLSINMFSFGGKSTVDLNGKFVFSQVLIDCLLRLKSDDQDKNELMQLLKQQYHDNRFELEYINDFKSNYRSNEVLQWYTKECFFYKTLNSVLRTENIHFIFLYRSFIFDLQQQLQKYQSNQIIRVYRAQIISKDELENLKKSINQFISINSFFSTTSNYQKALSFFNLSKPTEHTENILFSIEADPHFIKTKPFANISQFSDYPDEEEVLFMVGSIFQLKNISFDHKNQFSIIEMILSTDDESQLKQVLNNMKEQLGDGQTNLRILATILWEMGKLDLAEQYLKRFLEVVPSKDPLCEDIYGDLAKIASQSGDFDRSMKWRQTLINFKQNNPTASNRSIEFKENHGFAVPFKYDKVCRGRLCACCGKCRDWYFDGDKKAWQWIQNYKNWTPADVNRWYNDKLYNKFKMHDGGKCVYYVFFTSDWYSLKSGCPNDFPYFHHFHYFSRIRYCLCDDNRPT